MLSDYQKFIHKSRYARYLDEENRRETWEETVQRYAKFWQDKEMPLPNAVVTSILNMDVVPSMRALMTAGPALERDNMAGYNCAFIAVGNFHGILVSLCMCVCWISPLYPTQAWICLLATDSRLGNCFIQCCRYGKVHLHAIGRLLPAWFCYKCDFYRLCFHSRQA